jgi:hypothetical protein
MPRTSAPSEGASPGRAGLGLLVSACSLQRVAWQFGLPGTETSFTVQTVVPRGGYLDAVLKGPNLTLRTFTVDSDECRQVLMPEKYLEGSPEGGSGGATSHATARASGPWPSGVTGAPVSRASRSRGHRPSSNAPRPTAKSSFVRGRFPLAALVGWVSLDDTVAALPDTPSCRKRADEGVGSLEFRQSGLDPLILVASEGSCPLIGLLRPLDAKPAVRRARAHPNEGIAALSRDLVLPMDALRMKWMNAADSSYHAVVTNAGL